MTFLDPPKLSAMPALKDLISKGITIKVRTDLSCPPHPDRNEKMCALIGMSINDLHKLGFHALPY